LRTRLDFYNNKRAK